MPTASARWSTAIPLPRRQRPRRGAQPDLPRRHGATTALQRATTAHGRPTIAPTTRPPMHATATPRQPMPRRTPARPTEAATRATRRPDSKADAKTGDKTDTKDASSKDTDKTATTEADATAPDRASPSRSPRSPLRSRCLWPRPTLQSLQTAPETTGAAQPLAIAAAVLKAQTAATEAATRRAPKRRLQRRATEAEANFAALIASATPAGGKAGAKKTGDSRCHSDIDHRGQIRRQDEDRRDGRPAQPTEATAARTRRRRTPSRATSPPMAQQLTRPPLHRTPQSLRRARPEHRTEHAAQAAARIVAAPTTNTVQQQPSADRTHAACS